MRGRSPIRITKNDIAEYQRLVRNSKAKIRRTNKNYGIDLSNEINLPSIDSFKTRADFNQWKGEVKKFTNRANTNYQFKKNEYGVVASVKEINEIKRNTMKAQKIAKKLQKQAKDKPFISGGKEQGTVGQRMMQMDRPNTAGIYIPPDFNFDKIRTKKQLSEKKQNMIERSDENFFDKRTTKMKDNFIELLSLSLHSEADVLVERLKGIPADDFYEMYLMFDEFDFALYDSEGVWYDDSEASQHVSKMMAYVDRYYNGGLNMDLKGF